MANATDDTRTRLLEAAGEVFAEKGFRAATVRDICGRADANLAAVNYHFGDKLKLYVEVVQHAQGDGGHHPPPEFPPGTPPEVKLREYVHQMLSRLLDPRRPAWHAQLMTREMTEPTEACVAVVEKFIRGNFQWLDAVLCELLPEGISAADRHLVAFSIVGQCLHFKIHRPIAVLLVGEEEYETFDVARLTDHIVRFSLAALGHERPLGETIDSPSRSSAAVRP
ncbi:MAG TPA: CerR family C-terminal domain-containing protein [Thermoguttaceae bacterium]|nr:CerR family C-terminal domain-containing protein [Thermoguttaceae bacterium]